MSAEVETLSTKDDAAAVVITDDENPVVPNGDAAPGGKGKKYIKKDERPVEEIYDLSQPIPRVRLI
jgi:hypothetical protein